MGNELEAVAQRLKANGTIHPKSRVVWTSLQVVPTSIYAGTLAGVWYLPDILMPRYGPYSKFVYLLTTIGVMGPAWIPAILAASRFTDPSFKGRIFERNPDGEWRTFVVKTNEAATPSQTQEPRAAPAGRS